MNQDRNYWKLGITIFVSLSATVCFFFLIFRFGEIRAALGIIRSALQPLFVGIALAYVLCPVEKRLERLLGRAKGLGRFARPISVLLTMIAALAILVLFCALVVPQLVDSISGLVRDLPKLLETQLEKLNRYLKSDNDAAAAVMQMIESSENSLLAWIRTNLLATVSTVATSILSMGSALINTVASVVVTIYLLLGREHYLAQCRKLFLSVSRNERFNRAVFEALTQTNRIFNGFISGKLLDSLIVGIICFVCLSLLRMPYALLISVIVGMTNIIPMFGPFIGAVPSAFLLLLVSPMKCLIFLVFIIILQQVDGNIIGPRILGNSTGLSALYVTVAMLLFGKLMGFFGMIVGVPLFATLYYIVKRLAEYSLRKQGLPADTKEYVHRKNTELVQEGAAGEGRKE
ncbi:MAG: AI-2E family transporter [Lachnospiraceae bacterium]|nr:AI-2E family transporter [uncultured Acetatifactor sp.]MCI8543516.1 AI-2E family transporter [Lachnospiraceae bacterium]